MHTSWCDQARTKLAAMDALVAQGRGNTLVSGGGCTEPGGGIVPTTHTAREMTTMLRQQIARCGAGMLAQQPGEMSWTLNTTRQLSQGTQYQFILAIPSTMQDCCGTGSANDLLTQQGWSVTSYGAPPAGYAQALETLVSQSLPTPQVFMVLATWQGTSGAVLPPNSGMLYFGPVWTGYAFVGPPAPEPQPEAPVTTPPVEPSVWPSVLGFAAGVALLGGAWWYVRKTMVPRSMVPSYENPRTSGCMLTVSFQTRLPEQPSDRERRHAMRDRISAIVRQPLAGSGTNMKTGTHDLDWMLDCDEAHSAARRIQTEMPELQVAVHPTA